MKRGRKKHLLSAGIKLKFGCAVDLVHTGNNRFEVVRKIRHSSTRDVMIKGGPPPTITVIPKE